MIYCAGVRSFSEGAFAETFVLPDVFRHRARRPTTLGATRPTPRRRRVVARLNGTTGPQEELASNCP